MLKWQDGRFSERLHSPEMEELFGFGGQLALPVADSRDPLTIEAQLHEKRMSSHWLRELDAANTQTPNTGEENEQ